MLPANATRILLARRTISRSPAPVRKETLTRYLIWSIVSSTIMLSFPSWIIMHESGLAFAFMLALSIGTFWSASFVLAPVVGFHAELSRFFHREVTRLRYRSCWS